MSGNNLLALNNSLCYLFMKTDKIFNLLEENLVDEKLVFILLAIVTVYFVRHFINVHFLMIYVHLQTIFMICNM
jgi:hypothetical protein